MKSLAAVSIILIIISDGQVLASDNCTNPNEAHTDCGNHCTEKCPNPTGELELCTFDCKVGCFCKPGFKRDPDENCILEEECPKKADFECKDPNEKYNTCGNSCAEQCDEGIQRFCTLQCQTGCFCKAGFKRNSTGVCVEYDKCPKNNCNDPNEEFKDKGNTCSESCDRAVKLCPNDTHPGCFCKTGFLRDPKTGMCIPEEQCPEVGQNLICGHTEVYKCGNRCWDYCDDGALRKCSGDCRYGCHCKDGHKFNQNTQECVLEGKCPCFARPTPSCPGKYEVWKEDGSHCADKCNKHLVRCANDQKPGCYCIDGYARDLETGVCRPYPCEECGENAEYVVCADACDNECSFVLNKDFCKINFIQCPDGCRCKKRFARATNATCIPESQCS